MTRVSVQEARLRLRVEALLKPTACRAVFSGDPRGAVLKIQVPSGRDSGWGGMAVPSGPSGLRF